MAAYLLIRIPPIDTNFHMPVNIFQLVGGDIVGPSRLVFCAPSRCAGVKPQAGVAGTRRRGRLCCQDVPVHGFNGQSVLNIATLLEPALRGGALKSRGHWETQPHGTVYWPMML